MSGYIRQSAAAISDGNTITASDEEAEFDALVSAFDANTGHKHNGTAGEGKVLTAAAISGGALAVTSLSLDTGTKTASATAGAATLNKNQGKITSEALTAAAGSDYVLTLSNNTITASCIVLASVDNGTNTTEGLAINRVTPGSLQVVIRVRNTHASSALNGTIVVSYMVLQP